VHLTDGRFARFNHCSKEYFALANFSITIGAFSQCYNRDYRRTSRANGENCSVFSKWRLKCDHSVKSDCNSRKKGGPEDKNNPMMGPPLRRSSFTRSCLAKYNMAVTPGSPLSIPPPPPPSPRFSLSFSSIFLNSTPL